VVAVIRGDEAVPAPGPEFPVEFDDTLVVVGTPAGIQTVIEILAAG
jgi:TrkA domain protein